MTSPEERPAPTNNRVPRRAVRALMGEPYKTPGGIFVADLAHDALEADWDRTELAQSLSDVLGLYESALLAMGQTREAFAQSREVVRARSLLQRVRGADPK